MDPAQPQPPPQWMSQSPQDLAPTCALHPGVRAEQACSRCGNFACRACLRSAPDGRPLCVTCDSREGAAELPWDLRHQQGTLSAFTRTCWAIVWHPGRTLDRATPAGSAGSSLWFGVLATITTYLTTGLVYGALTVTMVGILLFGGKPGEKTIPPLTTAAITVFTVVTLVLFVLLLGLGSLLLLSLLDHVVLSIAGAKPRSYLVTLRAHALSLAPCLAGLVPVCGVYAVPIWAVVIRIFAYRGLHRISTGKAVAGALAAPALILILAMVGWAVAFAMSMAGASGNP